MQKIQSAALYLLLCFLGFTSIRYVWNDSIAYGAEHHKEPGQLESVVASIKDKKINFDLIVLPQDSYIATNQKVIIDAINAAKIPIFGTIGDYHDAGALVVMTPDFEKVGRNLAAMIDEHQQGALLSQIPVITDEQPKIIVNDRTASLLGLTEKLKDK